MLYGFWAMVISQTESVTFVSNSQAESKLVALFAESVAVIFHNDIGCYLTVQKAPNAGILICTPDLLPVD